MLDHWYLFRVLIWHKRNIQFPSQTNPGWYVIQVSQTGAWRQTSDVRSRFSLLMPIFLFKRWDVD